MTWELKKVTLWGVYNGWNNKPKAFYTNELAAKRHRYEDEEVREVTAWHDGHKHHFVTEISEQIYDIPREKIVEEVLSKFTDDEIKFLKENPEYVKQFFILTFHLTEKKKNG